MDALRIAGLVVAATTTGAMLAVSTISVPMAQNTLVRYTPDQRQAIWRQLFISGQSTFSPTLFASASLLGLAAYTTDDAHSRKLLAGACASFIGVMISTPVVMLGFGLRENLLTKTGGKDRRNEAEADKYARQFYLFHGWRTWLGALGTMLAAYELYVH